MEIDQEIQKLKWFPSDTATYSEEEHSNEKVKQSEVEWMVNSDSIIHSV